jgi:hypothetical protein
MSDTELSDEQMNWALLSRAADQVADTAAEVAAALREAKCQPDGAVLVHKGTRRHVDETRAGLKLLVDIARTVA